ncbi:hypothetical protein [Streptomyces hydrogenans]|uniref:hypothetical protein n=1 Tax=Streptomyces hydrogenans TaxID=1873719 RepID=UPI0036618EC8
MLRARVSSRRRLAAALLALSTVTAVTGTLVTAPVAAAATADALGRCVRDPAAQLPVGAEIVSTGAFGYVTTCTDEAGETRVERHALDGTVTALGVSAVYDSSSDWMVTNNNGTLTAWNPTTGTYANHTLRGDLVGVAYNVAYESLPAESGEGRELWQLRNDNGTVNRTKLTDSVGNAFNDYTETAHKVVAAGRDADGRPTVLILGKGYRTVLNDRRPYTFQTRLLIPTGGPITQESLGGGGDWNETTTGAVTPKYRASITDTADGGHSLNYLTVGSSPDRDIPLTDIAGQPVLAGIIGDTALYAARRAPGAGPEVLTPLFARNLATGGAPYKVLENFSSVAHAPDGSLLVRGASGTADGLFALGRDGTVTPTLVADTGRVTTLKVTGSSVPVSVNLEKPGTAFPLAFELSRADATLDLTLTHARTGKKVTLRLEQDGPDPRFTGNWNGILDGISAPDGGYTWQATAISLDGASRATASGVTAVTRSADPHDYNANGSTDVLARDAAGALWRDDLFDWPVGGQAKPARRTLIGSGWNTYQHIEAAGNIGGAGHGDLIGVDGSGYLWHYLGKGDGTFTARTKVGGGWQGYRLLAAGSDLAADGRADLFAVDASGVLWFYAGSGSTAQPYQKRVSLGGGWQVYAELTAVGNIVGDAGGDLVARDRDGVLWLYEGKGYGFKPRVKVGGGWQAFSRLVGAGDVTGDGRPDLIAYGAGGTYVYRSNGTVLSPFTRQATSLYAGEGTKFTQVS